MIFKKFLRYFTFALVLGAILILGFLAFSGIYVLAPILPLDILPLAIAAFLLSVIFEGEIFYQNISKAVKSLIKPHYIESKLAEECLQEAIEDISAYIKENYSHIEPVISAIDEFICTLDDTRDRNSDCLREKYNKIKIACEAQNPPKLKALVKKINDKLFDDFANSKPQSINFASPTKGRTTESRNVLVQELTSVKKNLLATYDIPKFFEDYARIATIEHSFAHVNPTPDAKKQRKSLNVTLKMLEQLFTEQLFPHTQRKAAQNKSGVDNEYKLNLKKFLEVRYSEKYKAKLPNRKRGSKFIKVLSTVCACVMMLGTSYLLVEAFAVVPLLAAIPFGILPVVIVPLAILSGVAYGIQTYRALDEILNSDVITKRLAKIRADIKKGLTLYTGAKLLIFILLLGLAITLTVCTGGTWYTVIKHTKPIFAFLSKIPAAVMVIISVFLAVAAFAFNVSNSAQTSEELEEAFESQVPEDHPYNIDLLEVNDGFDIESNIKYVNRTAIIKKGNDYFIHCCPNGHNWQRIKVSKDSYLFNVLLNRLNFSKNILYYSAFNTALYSLIRQNTTHKFNPSKENWKQFFNPFRLFLIVTYVPIRILFFLGHLASISATSDRIPGIPDVISMMIGFIAELFEDLHYFTSFEHNHKEDVPAIVAEHFKDEGGCDHANDLPTRVLRDYLFFPIFWMAAAWHSIYSDKKEVRNVSRPREVEKVPSISHENALEMLRGKKPISDPKLVQEDKDYVTELTTALNEEEITHKKDIESQEDLVTIQESCENVVLKLSSSNNKSNPFRIFAGRDTGCLCHTPQISRNQILLP